MRLFVFIAVPMAVNREILAERMSFPIIRHHDPSQMRVITKPNAEQIERLTLIPIRAVPHSRYRIDFGIIAVQPAL